MARQRFSAEQIIHKLREADVELSKRTAVKQVCRQLGITAPPISTTTARSTSSTTTSSSPRSRMAARPDDPNRQVARKRAA